VLSNRPLARVAAVADQGLEPFVGLWDPSFHPTREYLHGLVCTQPI